MAHSEGKYQGGMHWSEQVLAYSQGLPMPGIPEDATVCTDLDSSEYEYAAAPGSLTENSFELRENLSPEDFLGRFWNYHKWYSTPAGTRYVAHAPRNPADEFVRCFDSSGQAVGHAPVVKDSSVNIASGSALSDDSLETRGPSTLDGPSLGQIIDAGFNFDFSLNLDHFSAPFPSSRAIPVNTPSYSPSPPPHSKQPHVEEYQPCPLETDIITSSHVNKPHSQKGTGPKKAFKKKNMAKKPLPKPTASALNAEASSKLLSLSPTPPVPALSFASIYAPLPLSDLPAEHAWDDTSSKPWTKVVNKKKEAALKKSSAKASPVPQTPKNAKVSPKDKIKTTGSGNSPAQPTPSTSSASARQNDKKKQPDASRPVSMELPPCLSAISPPRSTPVRSSPSQPAPVPSSSPAIPVSSLSRTDTIVPSHQPAPISPDRPISVSFSPHLASTSPSRLDPVPSTLPVEPEETSSHSSDGSSSSIEIITERPSAAATYREASEESVERTPVPPLSTGAVPVPMPAAIIPVPACVVLVPEQNSKPFIIETEDWRNKVAETQLEIDETIATAKQAQDVHGDEKRRALADAHLKLVETTRQYAHQNPQIAFGNPNALPWPLGMPLMTDDEYREAGRSYPNGIPAIEKAAGYTYWQKPVGVAEPPVRRRQTTRQVPVPAPAFTFPEVTTELNLTGKVSDTPQLSSTETSLSPSSNIPPTALVPVTETTPIESIDSLFDNRAFAVSVVSNLLPALPTPLDWCRRTVSFFSPLDSIDEPSPDPLARPGSAPMNLDANRIDRMITQTSDWLRQARLEQSESDQIWFEQAKSEKAKPEHLSMQSLRTDSTSLTPDTPHEFFDARQEQNTSPIPTEKSDRPTSPGIATEPVTERTTPQGSPKRSCLKSPEAKMESPSPSVHFDKGSGDSTWKYPSSEKMQVIRDSCLHKSQGVRILLTPVTNLSAKPSECKAHKEILMATSPFLAAALQVIKEDGDGITRIHLHGGPRFNCHTAFDLALDGLYDPKRKLSHENIRYHAINGLGGEPRKKDSDMTFSVHLAMVDFALCYGSAGAFFGYQPAVTRAIELILDLLDWESADFLLSSCLLVGEYMLTVPALHPGAVKPTPAVVRAGQIGDQHMSNFHLNEIGIVKKALFKFMASNIMPGFKLYERAQATYYATRIPRQIWTLPGSYMDNMSIEAVRYGGNLSFADPRPKRLDITILSAMLITLPFCFFMNLIDEMKKARAPALTVELMKEVVGLREERRTWALHIFAQKRLPSVVIDQAYLEELAYREFVLFERAADQCVSNAMVHRIWVGLDPPVALPSHPLTLADLEAFFEPNSYGEGPSKRASRNKNNMNNMSKGKKGNGTAVSGPTTQTITGKKSTIQTPSAPGSKVEIPPAPNLNVPTPPVPGTIAQTPNTPVPDGEQPQTPRKKKNKKNRKKKSNATQQ
ncbi:hypothetical protein N7448_001530 [Penicillium atrosanguineum]|nr:hypothetical protein N7448_001530 [Penicillium atrosanguineum]